MRLARRNGRSPYRPASGIVAAGAAIERALRRRDNGDLGCQLDAQAQCNSVPECGLSKVAGDAGFLTLEATAGAVLSFIRLDGASFDGVRLLARQ